ncbi:hypothetical protein TNCV_462761 [Trichonephila clavipes]|nr:hypothetical protein TNCV_462761 [Trichonephila clavipes]
MLKEGTIIPIQSPYASLVVLCRKNKGLPPDNPEAHRFSVDYCINAITKYPRYILPLIEDLITNIPHTEILSSLYLHSGYFQLAVRPSDVVKIAIVTKNGTFAFIRMPLGLSGAPPSFQKKAIDIILLGHFVSAYMVDVISLSPSFAHHVEHLREVLRSEETQEAFDAIKKAITEAPVLILPNFKRSFELFTDAISIGIGAVLNQEQKPEAFASRTLNSAERNYTERDCLAVIRALNKFRTYLGSLPVKVITHHVALTRLTHGKNLSSRMIRCVLKLAEFNVERKHHPELKMRWQTFCLETRLKV